MVSKAQRQALAEEVENAGSGRPPGGFWTM